MSAPETTLLPAPKRRIHPAWIVAGVAFLALVGAAGFRAAPGVLMVPLQSEFGWSTTVLSAAVSINLVLFGLTAPFAAALMERFGIRAVTAVALVLIAAGSALTVLVTQSWQILLTWGLLIGLGTGSMALVFAATIANTWFAKSRGLVIGILTAGSAAGQLVFLPFIAALAQDPGWRQASLLIAAGALAVVPLVLKFLKNSPADAGVLPYGAEAEPESPPEPDAAAAGAEEPQRNAAVRALQVLKRASKVRTFWALVAGFAICGATTNGLIGTHFIPSAHDHGMAPTTAAGLLAVVGIFDIVGTIASGWLTDRFNPRILLAVYYQFRGIGLLVLPLAAQRHRPAQHDRVRGDLRTGLGGHRTAHRRHLPPGLRRGRQRGVRLGLRRPPARRGRRGTGGRRHPGRHRPVHLRLVRCRRDVHHRRRRERDHPQGRQQEGSCRGPRVGLR